MVPYGKNGEMDISEKFRKLNLEHRECLLDIFETDKFDKLNLQHLECNSDVDKNFPPERFLEILTIIHLFILHNTLYLWGTAQNIGN